MLYPEEGRRLTLWPQMPDLPQDQPCQIQTDTNPKADTQTCLEKRGLCIHFCLLLIKNYVPCQPNASCCSDVSPD